MKALLHVDPAQRPTAVDILGSEWALLWLPTASVSITVAAEPEPHCVSSKAVGRLHQVFTAQVEASALREACASMPAHTHVESKTAVDPRDQKEQLDGAASVGHRLEHMHSTAGLEHSPPDQVLGLVSGPRAGAAGSSGVLGWMQRLMGRGGRREEGVEAGGHQYLQDLPDIMMPHF